MLLKWTAKAAVVVTLLVALHRGPVHAQATATTTLSPTQVAGKAAEARRRREKSRKKAEAAKRQDVRIPTHTPEWRYPRHGDPGRG